MNIIEKDILDIKPYEKNPRKNEAAVSAVANSIREFGFKVPVVIDKNNVIIAGHTRYKAAMQLGLMQIPCVIAEDLTPEKVKAFRLADNRVGEIAEWDYNLLEAELAEIENINMQSFNFDVSEINPDDFGENFDLPDGEKPEICKMSFTLHQKQKELVEYALGIVQDEVNETFGNANKNGNALYEVIRQWAEQRKSL